MTNVWSASSERRLITCHSDLHRVFNRVLGSVDCTIICGHRGRGDQEAAFSAVPRLSWARWGQSPHNFLPSLAVDVMPWPIDWMDRQRICLFAGFVLGTAREMGVDLKWGGDWNRNFNVNDERFLDFPHFELAGWREMEKVLGDVE